MSEHTEKLMLAHLAELWRLNERERDCLLSLGSDALPALLDIQQTLQQLFPHNPQLAELWPTTANKALANRSPLQVFEEEGIEGVESVRRFLCLHH